MRPADLACGLLSAISIAFTVAAAVLNGLCYASGKYSWARSRPLNLALVCLNAVACASLIVLALIRAKDVHQRPRRNGRLGIYLLATFYLLASAAFTAVVMAWTNWRRVRESENGTLPYEPLFISCFVVWGVSVVLQALFCGYLLVGVTCRSGKGSEDAEREREELPEDKSSFAGLGLTNVEMVMDSDRMGSLQTAWIKPFSDQAAGGGGGHNRSPTLSNCSKHSRSSLLHHQNSSSDINGICAVNVFATTTTAPPPSSSFSSTTSSSRGPNFDQTHHAATTTTDLGRTVSDSGNSRCDFRGRQLRVTSSLDDLIKQTVPEGAQNTRRSPLALETSTEEEDNVHPLFRASSPSPPPTPTDGTTVTASPVAGQTITTATLRQMRSISRLSNTDTTGDRPGSSQSGPGNESPPVNSSESTDMPRYMTNVRHSQLQYEKKYGSVGRQ